MNIWNSWATSYRNARGIGAAVVMLIAILSMLSLRCNPMVGRESVLGLVLVVEAENLSPFDGPEAMSRVLIATPDSSEIRMCLPPPVPRPGDFIRLTAEHYQKGNTEYFLDDEIWRLEGPQ